MTAQVDIPSAPIPEMSTRPIIRELVGGYSMAKDIQHSPEIAAAAGPQTASVLTRFVCLHF